MWVTSGQLAMQMPSKKLYLNLDQNSINQAHRLGRFVRHKNLPIIEKVLKVSSCLVPYPSSIEATVRNMKPI